MSTYSSTTATQTFKVEYEDPAGAFGGWFTFVFKTGLASTSTPVLDDNDGTNGSTFGPYTNASALNREFNVQVDARIATMHGANSAKWTAQAVRALTPAVFDLTYGDD